MESDWRREEQEEKEEDIIEDGLIQWFVQFHAKQMGKAAKEWSKWKIIYPKWGS